MAQTEQSRERHWTGKPWLARAIKLIVWVTPIAMSIVATHLLSRLVPRPQGAAHQVAWFVAMAIIATAVLYLVDKLARRLLPLAALFQLSLVFPDRAPSRFKAALRTRTVHQLEQRVAEIRSTGLSDDPAVAAETLIELVADLSAHDRLTRGHAERVRAYCQIIGEELKLKQSDVELLQWAGLLHDVGKLFVPDEILNKPGRLTGEEFDIIKKHPEWGAELCEPLRGWLGEWVDAVGQHHERWDGRGYPDGLAGNEISLAARIVSVADVYDVITSIRSYKDASRAEDARKELASCAGTQFDERIVRAFLNVSLGKMRLAMGPLAWLAQLPIIGRASLLPVAGTATSAVLTASGLWAGGFLGEAPDYEPARVEAAAPATTLDSTLPGIVITLPPSGNVDEPDTSIPETRGTDPADPASPTAATSTTASPSPTTTDDSTTPTTTGRTTPTTTGSTTGSTVPNTTPNTTANPRTNPTATTTTTTRPPTANNDVAPILNRIGPRTINELSRLNFTVSATDANLPADALTFTATGLPAGATLNASTGAFTWTPTEAQGPRSTSITFTATDESQLSDSERVTITVNEVNAAPVLSNPGNQTTLLGQFVDLALVAVDPDGPANNLRFSASGLPTGLAIDTATGRISGTATAMGSAAATITVTETNGVPTNLADTASFNWTVSGSSVVISEIATAGAGGSTDEFIELYNPTGGAVSMDGWKVQVSGGNANALTTITIPGGTTIGSNEYFLLAHSSANVATPDLAYGVNMPKGAGVSLVTDADVPVDAVGTGPTPWKDGSGSLYGEGTFLPPLDGNVNQSYERLSGVGNCADTDNNSADFFHNMTTRNPQGLGTFETCGNPPPFVPPPPADHVVISEFRLDGAVAGGQGGGNNEFVEIYNPTGATINISGYRLYSQDGSLQAIVPPATNLGSGRHFLFASSSFTFVEGLTPDVVSAGGIKNGEGMYLENASNVVIDAVSTGGNGHLEGAPLPPINGRVIHSYERLVGAGGGNCVDTDVNGADFFHNLSSQNPQTSLDPAVSCAG